MLRRPVLLPSFLVALLVTLATMPIMLGTVVSAAAHSALVSSTPKDGEKLAAMPTTAALVFNENIEPRGTQIVIADHADVAHPVTPQVDGPEVIAAIPEGLPDGLVHVRYRVVSADGHPISGETTFTVGDSHTGSNGDTAPAAPPVPTADPTSDGDGSTTMMYVLTGVAATVLVAAGLAMFLAGRRRP
ncbi:copper resistance CopC family protein [Mobilicoccus pelagius]|uniref:Copper resistance protein C n=1 Tax=Mobilicoccus pelagius NBRC 104925 TaxID=1089455 RepID=H5UVA3_9MICO|nr:copper resistance CopC family protein [Mobilicoccus pelagius]GAB49661.1 copper resistance protein C [Mobilicoccus pelagius NBRC 104925]